MRRHPILSSLAGLALLTVAGLALFLATFDLNRYRQELEGTLESSLGRRVEIGTARFSINYGPALDFGNLEIGRNGDPLLRARHLFVRLSWQELLRGRLAARELLLEAPQLFVVLSPNGRAAETSPPIDLALLERLAVQSCIIEDGRFSLVDRRRTGEADTLVLSGLNGRISQLAPGQTGALHFTGRLEHDGERAGLAISGKVELTREAPFWRTSHYEVDLHLNDLPLNWLPPGVPPLPEGWSLQGLTTLQLQLTGRPDNGFDTALTLDGSRTELQLPEGVVRPELFDTLQLQGTWLPRAEGHRFQDLRLRAGTLQVTGSLDLLQRSTGLWLGAQLYLPSLSLPDLLNWLPDREDTKGPGLRRRLAAGELSGASVSVQGTLAELAGPEGLGRVTADAELVGGIFDLPGLGRLEEGRAQLHLAERILHIAAGGGRIEGGELSVAGDVQFPAAASPRQNLVLTGRIEGQRLLALLPDPPSGLNLRGPVACRLTLSGPLLQPQGALSADLRQLAIGLPSWYEKPAGLAAELTLPGRLGADRLHLEDGRLRLPPFAISAGGSLDLAGARPFSLTLALSRLRLESVPERVAALGRLQPRGEVSAEARLLGKAGRIEDFQADLTLEKVGVHLTRVIADLNDVSGRLRIAEGQARFSGLGARIGRSPITLSGTLRHPGTPLAELHLTAPAIRADDLIFPSEQAVLRDLDAHLRINRDRLEFAPVTVRLDGGTKAQVRGAVSNFQAPAVNLEITASYGDIDEVIALWHREGPPPPPPPADRPPPRLLIRAKAARGVIAGMEFQDAEGRITQHGEVLVIHPLHCRIGPGYVIGQVLVDHGAGSPPLLRISGHAEDVDANRVHQQLLNQKSLVKGALRGDFYLQGRTGKDFLPTSLGGFSVEIRDGVLRKFRSLSKVFSLLNVSQILTLKLPDMDREGMPFGKVTGNFRLDQGILSSEDLFAESNAMNLSLVGDMDLVRGQIDAVLGVKPLRTVDKILTRIPLAGWLLAGEEKALITAHFAIRGATEDPEVVPVPISSVSEKVRGVFRRVLGLPGKVVGEMGELIEGD